MEPPAGEERILQSNVATPSGGGIIVAWWKYNEI